MDPRQPINAPHDRIQCPVNPIYASALSRSTPFFEELGQLMGMPYHQFEYNGAAVPMFQDGPIWNSPVELLLASSNFFIAVNEVPFNVRDFCFWLHESTGNSVSVSDIGPSFHEDHGLFAEECVVLEASHFWLPGSFDKYLSSLAHDDRKTLRKILHNNRSIEVVFDNDGRRLWEPMRQAYTERMMKKFGYTAQTAEKITGTIDLTVKHMAKLGTGLIVGMFSEGHQVAASIFERSRGCVFHYTDITVPSHGTNLCRFSITKAIEYAINEGDSFFDVGHIWNDISMKCDFSFKRRYVPKSEKRKNELYCFGIWTSTGKDYYLSKYPYEIIYAPFYLDGKIQAQHYEAISASEAQLAEHRILNAEVLRSNRSRGTISNMSTNPAASISMDEEN